MSLISASSLSIFNPLCLIYFHKYALADLKRNKKSLGENMGGKILKSCLHISIQLQTDFVFFSFPLITTFVIFCCEINTGINQRNGKMVKFEQFNFFSCLKIHAKAKPKCFIYCESGFFFKKRKRFSSNPKLIRSL